MFVLAIEEIELSRHSRDMHQTQL